MVIKKDVLQQIGGFDLSLTAGEDSDILWRVKKAGWKVIYNGRLKVFETDHRRLENGVFRKIWLGGIRNLFLIIGGRFSQKVRKSDWGYWKKV